MIDVDTVYSAVGGTSTVRHNSSRLQDKLSAPLNLSLAKATTAVSTNNNNHTSYPASAQPVVVVREVTQEPQSPRQSSSSTGSIGLLKSLTNSLTSKPWQSKSNNAQKMATATAAQEAKPSTESRSTFRSLLPIRRQAPPPAAPRVITMPEQSPLPALPPVSPLSPLSSPKIESLNVPQWPQALPQPKLNSLPPSAAGFPSSSSSSLQEPTEIAPTTASAPRPLPTPPKARRVRFAVFHEVLEIDNIDDLTLMGYYDDYDSELGWNYRNESLDDTVMGEDGFEYDYDYEDYDEEEEEDEDMEPSPTVELRMPVNYGDLVYHQPLHPSLQQPFYQAQQQQENLHSRTPSEEGRYAESEASTMDDESIIAEDDIIYRFGMDGLYTMSMSTASMVSLQNYQGIMQRFQNFDARMADKNNNSSSAAEEQQVEEDTLACSTTPAAEDQATPALNKEPSRLKSPPPPSRMRYSPPLPSPTPSPAPQLNEQQTPPPPAVESLFSRPYSPVPMDVDEEETTMEAPRATVNSSPEPPTSAPRLNRNKIMEQVAERKRNRAGVFARRASLCGPSALMEDKEPHRGLWNLNTSSLSMASSTSSSATPSLDSDSGSSSSSSESESPSSPESPVVLRRTLNRKPSMNRWSTGQYCIRTGGTFPPIHAIQAEHVGGPSPLVAC